MVKGLEYGYKNITGKNNTGVLTFYHRGGGHKRKFKVIDFRKKFLAVPGYVLNFEYDNFRKNDLVVIGYSNGIVTYNIRIAGVEVGDDVNDFGRRIIFGSTYFLKQLPIGVYISLVQLTFNKELQIARAPGVKAQIVGKAGKLVSVKFPSGITRKFLNNCKAVYGIVAVNEQKAAEVSKAGRNRNNNRRPIVRGVAMNPIDHPHGGGQGKTSGGRKMSVSPWSKYTKGLKPKRKKAQLSYIL